MSNEDDQLPVPHNIPDGEQTPEESRVASGIEDWYVSGFINSSRCGNIVGHVEIARISRKPVVGVDCAGVIESDGRVAIEVED